MKKVILLLGCGLLILGFAENGFTQIHKNHHLRPHVRETNDPQQSQALTNDALRLYKEGKIALAAEKLRQAIRLDERNDRALALSAEIALQQGRLEIARLQAERAVGINSRNARAHFVYGQILIAAGKYLAGFDHIHKAAGLLPQGTDRDEAHAALARLKSQHPEWFRQRTTTTPARVVAPAPADRPLGAEAQLANKPRVAVFTFENVGMVDSTMKWGETISEMLTTALINTNRFKVIERAQLSKVLQEQALGQSGALDAETAVVVGKIMGLDAVVVGSLSQLASVYEADARILNVESGEAVTAANGRAGSVDQLRTIAESLAGSLATRVHEIPIRAVATDSAR